MNRCQSRTLTRLFCDVNATAGGNHDNRVIPVDVPSHRAGVVPDRSRTWLSGTFRTFCSVLCSFSPQSQHRKTNLLAAAVTSFGAALCFNFIFLAVLPPPLGGFWTRFSGLFGQVERGPEEAEFPDLGRSPPSLSLPVRLTPLGSRQLPQSSRRRRTARFRSGRSAVKRQL